jgi:hypothetical protein
MFLKAINNWLQSLIFPYLLTCCFLGFTYVYLRMLEIGLIEKSLNSISIGYLIFASVFHFGWAIYLIILEFRKKSGK